MSMAMTARSQAGTSEARIPCPVCAHPIHPIAGRCKHCKSDLVKLREARGVRAPRINPASLGAVSVATPSPFAPAPVLAASTPTVVAAPSLASVDATPMPMPVPAALLLGDGELIAATPPRRSRWPLIVAIVAGIAIVVCLALLLGGDKSARAGSQKRPVGGDMLAPDRMDTLPAPPVPTPMRPDRSGPLGTAPTPDPTPDPDLQNPFDPPPDPSVPTPSLPPGAVPTAESFVDAVIHHACDRLRACGADQTIDMMCSAADSLGVGDLFKQQARSGRCTYDEAAAATCLAAIDGFQCGGTSGLDLDQLGDIFQSIASCPRALSCP